MISGVLNSVRVDSDSSSAVSEILSEFTVTSAAVSEILSELTALAAAVSEIQSEAKADRNGSSSI